MQRSNRRRLGFKRAFVLSAAAAALIGLSAGPALAQDDELKTYESELYGFTIEWNGDVWNSTSTGSFGDQETIWISNGVTSVELTATPRAGAGLDNCVDAMVDATQSDAEIDDAEIVNDLEALRLDDISEHATLTYEQVLEGRESPVAMGQYLGCTSLDNDGLLIVKVDTRLGIWGEEIEIVQQVLDSLETGRT